MKLSTVDLARYVTKVKAEINVDVLDGRVPGDVADFSALHDHVDANDYLITAGVPWDVDEATGETDLDPTNDVTDAVNAWIVSGGLRRVAASFAQLDTQIGD